MRHEIRPNLSQSIKPEIRQDLADDLLLINNNDQKKSLRFVFGYTTIYGRHYTRPNEISAIKFYGRCDIELSAIYNLWNAINRNLEEQRRNSRQGIDLRLFLF